MSGGRLPLESTVLLVIDVQKGFDEYVEAGQRRNNPQAESNIARLLAVFRERGGNIIHVRHASTESDSVLRPELPGHQVKDEARELPGEPVLIKRVNSAFIGTDLEARLRTRRIENLVIVGATTNHCVETTTRMAGNLGFNAYLVEDATFTFDRTAPDGEVIPAEVIQKVTMTNLNGEFATIIDTDGVIDSLAETPATPTVVSTPSAPTTTGSSGDRIRITNLSKHFGDVIALSELSLTVDQASIALLGRNGAGKSTLLNLLSGILLPTMGEITIGGERPGSATAAGMVARQLEFPGSAGFLDAARVARLLRLDSMESDRFREYLRRFDVPPRSMSKLSRGNQLKTALAVSFARDRPILLLDEPTSGLDIFGVEVLTDLIEDRQRRGLITVAATHQPTLTPDLFDRAIVIDRGALLFDGDLPSLLALAPDTPENSAPTARLASAFIELLKDTEP